MATSYANNSGSGERRGDIVLTTNILRSTPDGGPGDTGDWMFTLDSVTASGGREPGNGNNGNDRNITWDFGVGARVIIDEIKHWTTSTTTWGSWTIDGSNDNSAWTTLKSSFTVGGINGANAYSFTNSTGYRYYRMHTTSMQNGGGGNGFWCEFDFKIDDLTQSTRCSLYNTGGKGNRSSSITVTTDLTLGGGLIGAVVDGDYTDNTSHAITLNSGQTTKKITFDFTVGVVIDTVVLYAPAAGAGNTHGVWKLQGSPDNASYTDIGSSFNLFETGSDNVVAHTVANASTAYRYYRLQQVSGTTATNPDITEIEFRIYTPNTAHPKFQTIIVI